MLIKKCFFPLIFISGRNRKIVYNLTAIHRVTTHLLCIKSKFMLISLKKNCPGTLYAWWRILPPPPCNLIRSKKPMNIETTFFLHHCPTFLYILTNKLRRRKFDTVSPTNKTRKSSVIYTESSLSTRLLSAFI